MAQTSHQGQKVRSEAQSAQSHWHHCHISSAAIIAALPFFSTHDEQFSIFHIFGVST
jgi:hypothetical protein